MSDQTIEKLMHFGLSLNQAKVYCTLLKSNCKNVSELAHLTNIQPQDIYRILKKLEEKGLVLVSFSKPVTIESIAFDLALKKLIDSEREKSEQKAQSLENDLLEIKESMLKEKKSSDFAERKEELFILRGMTKARLARLDLTFENMRKEYVLVASDNGHFSWMPYLQGALKKLARHRVAVKVLVVSDGQSENLQKQFENIMPVDLSFEIRRLEIEDPITYALIDFNEVWVPTSTSDECVLITNSKTIVTMARKEFEFLWTAATPYAKKVPAGNAQKNERIN